MNFYEKKLLLWLQNVLRKDVRTEYTKSSITYNSLLVVAAIY